MFKRKLILTPIVIVALLALAACSTPRTTATPAAPPPAAQPAATEVPSEVTPATLPDTGAGAPAPAASAPAGTAQKPQPAAPAAGPAPSNAQVAAIQSVIQKGNQEQVQAVAANNPSAMQDTATAGFYQQSVQDLSDMLRSGVKSIQLLDLKWGPITLQNATTAQATTYETWSTTFSDGSTMQETDTNVYTVVLQNGAWKIQTDDHPNTRSLQPGNPGGTTAPGTPSAPITPAPGSQSADNQSRNWSGYAATGGAFTAVSGTWTVPNVSAGNGNTVATDATWVGIGGVTDTDLIQAGTQAVVQNGQVQYTAWWETLPQANQPVALDVSAGDSVTVSIAQQSDGTWQIRIDDATNHQTWQNNISYQSSRSSAEWVEEAPSTGRRTLLPIDNFGQVTFTDASTVENGKTLTIAQAHASPVTMNNGAGQALAQTSALAANGSSFTVVRTDVAAPSLSPNGRRFRGGGSSLP